MIGRGGGREDERSAPQRRILLELLQAALTAVDGRRCTRQALGTRVLDGRPVWAAAIGKAASSMALGAADVLGASLERLLLVTKDGHTDGAVRQLSGIEAHECGHPLPDERSLAAGARLLRFIDDMPAGVQPLFLISGGASSLIEALVPGATLADLQRLNAEGLASGVPIGVLNARRREISLVKGGRLASRLEGRGAVALFISDVPDDDPAVIGSGVMGPAMDRGPSADSAGTRYGRGSDGIERIIIASIDDARRAVQAAADGLTVRMPAERFSGNAERLAERVARDIERGESALSIWGGESVLELPPQPGCGGRNQHLALAAARLIAGRSDLFVLAAGTDGTDGPTADAGALVDGKTCGRVAGAGLDVDECLRRADSGTALAAAGDLVHTGPTGTNVGDLILGLKLSDAQARSWKRYRAPADHR